MGLYIPCWYKPTLERIQSQIYNLFHNKMFARFRYIQFYRYKPLCVIVGDIQRFDRKYLFDMDRYNECLCKLCYWYNLNPVYILLLVFLHLLHIEQLAIRWS